MADRGVRGRATNLAKPVPGGPLALPGGRSMTTGSARLNEWAVTTISTHKLHGIPSFTLRYTVGKTTYAAVFHEGIRVTARTHCGYCQPG